MSFLSIHLPFCTSNSSPIPAYSKQEETLLANLQKSIDLSEFIYQNFQELLQFSSLQKALQNRIQQDYQTIEQLDQLLMYLLNEDSKLLKDGGWDNPNFILNGLKNFVSSDKMNEWIAFKTGREPSSFLQDVEEMGHSFIDWKEEKTSFKKVILEQCTKDWTILASYVTSLINLFVDTLNFLYDHQNTISLWDRQLILFIICKFLEIPKLIASALTPFLGTSSKAYVVAYLIIAAFSALIYTYQKWVRPPMRDSSYIENMNESYKKGDFKYRVIEERILQKLIQKLELGNVILIGDSGCGKTGIVEAVVKGIVEEMKLKTGEKKIVPENLRKRVFFRENYRPDIAASSPSRFAVIQSLKRAINGCKDQAVLFLDECQSFVKDSDAFSALKPFLDLKDLRCILATTAEEWKAIRKNLDRDQALQGRVSKLKIKYASPNEDKNNLCLAKDNTIFIHNEDLEMILLEIYELEAKKIFRETGVYIFLEKGAIEKIVLKTCQAFPHQVPLRKAIRNLEELMKKCQEAYSPLHSISELDNIDKKQRLEAKRCRLYEERIGVQITPLDENELKQRKEAARKIQEWKRLELSYKRECFHLSQDPHFNNNPDLQKIYIFYRYYLCPILQKRIHDKMGEFREKMNLMIDDKLIGEYFS